MRGVNEDRVKLWIQALRSGEFEQTQGWLDKKEADIEGPVGNCCLGVAQHVAIRNGFLPRDRTLRQIDWGQAGMDNEIGEWFGFEPCERGDPQLGYFSDHGAVFCVNANDDLGWNFNQIADALQTRYITPENIEREA